MRSGMEIKRSIRLGGLLLAALAMVMLMVSMTESATSTETATRVELRRRSMSTSSSTEFMRSVAQKSRIRYQNVVRPLVMAAAAAAAEKEMEEPPLGTRVTADMFNDVGMLSLSEYLMDISIGTPPVSMQAVVDTGSDLLWAKCDPCNGVSCNSAEYKHKHSCSSSSSRYVNPASSSTYTPTSCTDGLCRALKAYGLSNCTDTDGDSDCNFLYAYGDGTYLLGNVAYDTVTLGGVSVPHIAFGCAHNVSISGGIDLAGIVGLGGGALSLPSQLRYPHFSYCLSSDPAATSTLRFGGAPATGAGAGISKILRNPISDTFYFLDVRDVAVQGRSVGVPPGAFDIPENGAGGMLIDSGTPVTFLDQNVYARVAAAVRNAVTALPKAAPDSDEGLQICYSYAPSSLSSTVMKFPEGLPDLGLIFGDHGAVWTVKAKNAFVYDASSRLACLGVVASNQISLLGSYWQHDLVLDYNLRDRILSFQAAQCHML